MNEVFKHIKLKPYAAEHPWFELEVIATGLVNEHWKPGFGYRLIQHNSENESVTVFDFERDGQTAIIFTYLGAPDREIVEAVLGWLSLVPGEVEAHYFESYNSVQLEFAKQHGEFLGLCGEEGDYEDYGRSD